ISVRFQERYATADKMIAVPSMTSSGTIGGLNPPTMASAPANRTIAEPIRRFQEPGTARRIDDSDGSSKKKPHSHLSESDGLTSLHRGQRAVCIPVAISAICSE